MVTMMMAFNKIIDLKVTFSLNQKIPEETPGFFWFKRIFSVVLLPEFLFADIPVQGQSRWISHRLTL